VWSPTPDPSPQTAIAARLRSGGGERTAVGARGRVLARGVLSYSLTFSGELDFRRPARSAGTARRSRLPSPGRQARSG